MQQCGQCGFKLTDAAIKMGYCPNCGSLLRVEGEAPQTAHVMEHPPMSRPPAALPTPSATAGARDGQPLPPAVLPIAGGGPPTPSPYTPERLSQPIPAPPPPATKTNAPQPQPVPAENGKATPTAAVPPAPVVVTRRRGGAGLGVALSLLVVLIVAAGALFVAGRNGAGPLAPVVRGTTGSAASTTTVAQGAPPNALPTATQPAPTATPLPPTATPLPTVPPAPPNFTTFTAADGTFGLNVPTQWQRSPVSSGLLTGTNFKSPLTSYELIAVDEAPSSSLDPQKIVTYLQSFATNSGGSDTVITQDATTTLIGTNRWENAEATYTAGDGGHKVIGLAITHGANTYLIFYDALAGSFRTDPGTTYDTMVRSFTFLG